MPVSRELREYVTPEQINTLESMMRIADTLSKLELHGLTRLSEEQYKTYLKYLETMEYRAMELEQLARK